MSEAKTVNSKNLTHSSEYHSDKNELADKELGLAGAIAKLLGSQELRNQFEHSPDHIAEYFNVRESDFEAFVSLCPDQLRRQASTLLNKRWHEVQRMVPLTIESLGKEAKEVFRFYATNDWPAGHRRHPVDALQFLQFLITNRILEPNKMEWKRMRRINSAAPKGGVVASDLPHPQKFPRNQPHGT